MTTQWLLERSPVSEQWRRPLLQRLDAVAVIHRLLSVISEIHRPIEVRWYRQRPLEAAVRLPDGRVIGVARLGPICE